MRATHTDRSRKFEPLLLSNAESTHYSPRGGEQLVKQPREQREIKEVPEIRGAPRETAVDEATAA